MTKIVSFFFAFILLIIAATLIKPSIVLSVWYKYSQDPVLNLGEQNAWDNNIVASPTVLFDGSMFKLWYGGHDGFNWRIGYATSTDGIIWQKSPSYVLNNFIDFNNKNVHDPRVILKDNSYQMWYGSSTQNISNIHINYTTSSDGVIWQQSLFTVLTQSFQWESSNGISFPFALFYNGLYRMWYGSFGSFNGITRWRIGYATSPDGIIWTKHSSPVLDITQPWEGAEVTSPTVLVENDIYHMWYHGSTQIGHATSVDGITWIKDSNNPVLSPSSDQNAFDNIRVSGPSVIKKDGIYYMWYVGFRNDGKISIGLATSESLPSPLPTTTPTTAPTPSVTPVASFTPTPTPTTTPTLTPTPSPTTTPTSTPSVTITPTPTLSPTPTTAQPFSPIIIIPGLGASWNPKDIFSCSLDTSGKWELAPYVSLYNRLINTLTTNAGLKLNQDVYVYTYDWRQPLDKQADRFKNYLDNIRISRPGDTRFRIIGHSLGGLIIRSYLTSYPVDQHIISVLSVGTPHFGTPLAYPLWENGKVDIDDLVMQIAISQVINHCRVIRTFIPPKINVLTYKFRSAREIVQYLVPIVRQLLPVFDYLRQNGNIKPSNQLVYQNDWVSKNPFPQDKFHIPFVTLSGSDFPTLRYIDVINPSIREKAFGEWLDGKPVGNGKINEGDGTILDISSQLEAAENVLIPGNHSDIISNNTGISKILDFLGLADIPLAPAVVPPEQISQNALTVSLSGDAQVKVTDPRGKLLEAKEDIFVSFDPAVGLYRLEVLPGKTSDAYLHLAEIVKREDPQTQSIPLHLTKNRPSRFYLIYNPLTSSHLQLIPL